MCLIIYRPDPSKHVPDNVFVRAAAVNDDGFGFAYRDNGANLIHWNRFAPRHKDEFLTTLRELDASPHPYVAHFRYATSGVKDESMAHPFEYDDPELGTILVFHNGVIHIDTKDKSESDTAAYTRDVLGNLPTRWWENPAYVHLVQQSVNGSRLLILHPEGEFLVNQAKWEQRDGVYFSTFPTGYYVPAPVGNEWRDVDDPDYTPWGIHSWNMYGPTNAGKATSKSDPKGTPVDGTAVIDDDEGDHFAPGRWFHGGHFVDPGYADESNDSGTAWCNDCGAKGIFYPIGGATFIEMDHAYPIRNTPEGQIDGDPVTVKQVGRLWDQLSDAEKAEFNFDEEMLALMAMEDESA